jgi:hypothetical protein
MFKGPLHQWGTTILPFLENREARPDMDAKLNSETHLYSKRSFCVFELFVGRFGSKVLQKYL